MRLLILTLTFTTLVACSSNIEENKSKLKEADSNIIIQEDTNSYTHSHPEMMHDNSYHKGQAEKIENYDYREKAIDDLYFGQPYKSDEIRNKEIKLLDKKYYVRAFDGYDSYYGIYKFTIRSTDKYSDWNIVANDIKSINSIIEAKYGIGIQLNERTTLKQSLLQLDLDVNFEYKIEAPNQINTVHTVFSSDNKEIKVGYTESHDYRKIENSKNLQPNVEFTPYFTIFIELKSLYLINKINKREKAYRDSLINSEFDKF